MMRRKEGKSCRLVSVMRPGACLVGMGMLLVLLMTGCAGQSGGRGPQNKNLTTSLVPVPVTSAAQVLPDAHDILAPLPAGVTPALSADEVLGRLLQTEGDNAAYLKDSSKLTVEVGLYTNEGLLTASRTPTENAVSYVFEGGQAPCPPSAGPPLPSGSPSPTSSQPTRCTAVFIANGNDGTTELISIWGVKGT